MSRLVELALADRARRAGLAELAAGRARAMEARRLLEQVAAELEGSRARQATTPLRRLARLRAAEPGTRDATGLDRLA